MTDKYLLWPKHRSMNRSELEEIEYYPEATPQFVADLYWLDESKPQLRLEQHGDRVSNGPLKVTLLSLQRDVRQYGKHKASTGVDVWSMVVSDATHGLFKVVLNSGCSQDIPHEILHVGSTIIIQEWTTIWHKDTDDGIKRGIVFISNFDWSPAPHSSPARENDSTVTPDYAKSWLDSKAIQRVRELSVMTFLESFQHDEGFFYWMEMTPARVRNGEFVDVIADRAAYQKTYSRKRPSAWSEEPCACEKAPHFFQECITLMHPLSEIDTVDLYDEVCDKLKARVTADRFLGLSDSHKRWCFYWYYSVNFFHLGGQEAQELPACFVGAVRLMFPSPSNAYTGFKGTEERRSALDGMGED